MANLTYEDWDSILVDGMPLRTDPAIKCADDLAHHAPSAVRYITLKGESDG